jgi:hypothetical protein
MSATMKTVASMKTADARRAAFFSGKAVRAAPARSARREVSTLCKAAVSSRRRAAAAGGAPPAPPSRLLLWLALIALLPSAALAVQAPLVGSPAPEFAATAVADMEFEDIKLSQYKVRGTSAPARAKGAARRRRSRASVPPPRRARARRAPPARPPAPRPPD